MNRYGLPDHSQIATSRAAIQDWSDPAAAYNAGYIGAYYDADDWEAGKDSVEGSGYPYMWADVASRYGMTGVASDTGIYLIHKEVEAVGVNVNTIAYATQPVGNCVSRGTQNALLHTLCAAVASGDGAIPDGMIEASATSNPLSSEVNYWFKWPGTRPGSDGWNASACLRVAKEKGGMLVRGDYRNIGGPDLRAETKATAHAYAAQSIPQTMLEIIHRNPLLAYAECETFEEIADAIASGHAVQTDGGQGWASSVDENGFARRSGSWSHSMCATGVVRTEAAKKKYNTVGLVLIQNSWANFNKSDSAKVMGTNFYLPKGSFFARWEDCRPRSWFAVTSVHGWRNRALPNWDMGELV